MRWILSRRRLRALPEAQRISPAEERARIYIRKGFRRAQNGNLDGVLDQFLIGIQFAPGVQFQDVPGFWDLPRDGHQIAVLALETLEMRREAARLQAIVDRHFRPRLIRQENRSARS